MSRLYPHASTALALRPLPVVRAILTGLVALSFAFAALAYALGVPLDDVLQVIFKGQGAAGIDRGSFVL